MSLDVWLRRSISETEFQRARKLLEEHGMNSAAFIIEMAHDDDYENAEVYSANITHNLNQMAREAGIYGVLWRPDEHGYKKGADIVPALENGLSLLKSDRPRFEKFNAPNGWGMYEHFVPFVEKYLDACRANPEAEIHVSR